MRVFYRYLCNVSDAFEDALGFHDIYLMDSKVHLRWMILAALSFIRERKGIN